jgi:hydrogenase/urease accessory protein HupE
MMLTALTTSLMTIHLASHWATAHPGHAPHDFAGGSAEPVSGLELVLATLVVWLCAMRLGGRARWVVPAAFVISIGAGDALHEVGFHAPMLEAGVFAAVIVFWSLIVSAVKMRPQSVRNVFDAISVSPESPASAVIARVQTRSSPRRSLRLLTLSLRPR